MPLTGIIALNSFQQTNLTFDVLVCLLPSSWLKAQQYLNCGITMHIQQTWEGECYSHVETRKENNYGKMCNICAVGQKKTRKFYSWNLSKFRIDVEGLPTLSMFRQVMELSFHGYGWSFSWNQQLATISQPVRMKFFPTIIFL